MKVIGRLALCCALLYGLSGCAPAYVATKAAKATVKAGATVTKATVKTIF